MISIERTGRRTAILAGAFLIAALLYGLLF